MFDSPFSSNVAFAIAETSELEAVILTKKEEAILLQSSSTTRQLHFKLGRHAAHKALAQLGAKQEILKDEFKAPVWPEGICGSISHCEEFAIAAVANKSQVKSIGLDIERIQFRDKLIQKLNHTSEVEWINENPAFAAIRFTQLFSAREAFFKALHPLVKKSIGYKDVVIAAKDLSLELTLLKELARDFPTNRKFQINTKSSGHFILSSLELEL